MVTTGGLPGAPHAGEASSGSPAPNGLMQGHHDRMTFFIQDTCRERARRLLNTGQPFTADTIAAELGTTRVRARIVLRELERQGAATRTRGGSSRAGRLPDQWTATR